MGEVDCILVSLGSEVGHCRPAEKVNVGGGAVVVKVADVEEAEEVVEVVVVVACLEASEDPFHAGDELPIRLASL